MRCPARAGRWEPMNCPATAGQGLPSGVLASQRTQIYFWEVEQDCPFLPIPSTNYYLGRIFVLDILSKKQVSQLFEIHMRTVSKWARNGNIPAATYVGRKPYWKRADIDCLMAQRFNDKAEPPSSTSLTGTRASPLRTPVTDKGHTIGTAEQCDDSHSGAFMTVSFPPNHGQR
jgi:hypothetical protein